MITLNTKQKKNQKKKIMLISVMQWMGMLTTVVSSFFFWLSLVFTLTPPNTNIGDAMKKPSNIWGFVISIFVAALMWGRLILVFYQDPPNAKLP